MQVHRPVGRAVAYLTLQVPERSEKVHQVVRKLDPNSNSVTVRYRPVVLLRDS